MNLKDIHLERTGSNLLIRYRDQTVRLTVWDGITEAELSQMVMRQVSRLEAENAIEQAEAQLKETKASLEKLTFVAVWELSWALSRQVTSLLFGREDTPPSPPYLAEFLLAWFAPKKSVQNQLGDLQEVFEKNCAKLGVARARRMYWLQVLRSIGPNLWRKIKRLGVIAFVIDYARSKMGF